MNDVIALISSIPAFPVFLLGIGATLKYAWKVFRKHDLRNIGALTSTLYMTVLYWALSSDFDFHGQSFVRVGVLLLFIDKIIVFLYDLRTEIKSKKKDGSL